LQRGRAVNNKAIQGYLKLALSLLFLLLLLLAINHWVGWRELLAPWQTLNPQALMLAALLIFASYAVRAVRLYDYFLPHTADGYAACLRLMLIHNLLNNLLPMRSGELSFPWLMRQYFHVPFSQATGTLLWFRLLDLHTLLMLGGIALADQVASHRATLWLLLLGWIALPWLAFRLLRHRTVAARTSPDNHTGLRARLMTAFQLFLQGLPGENGLFWRSWLWSIANWAVKLAVFAWILRMFLPMPLSQASLGVMSGELTTVLPVHGIGGAGTYEAGIVAGLSPFGHSLTDILRAAVNLHVFFFSMSLIYAGLALLLPRGPRS